MTTGFGDVIHLESLTKFYGETRALHDIDLTVRVGEVFGYLGPNGAGKTTTIRTLFDFIRPTSGKATVLGLDSQADAREIRRRVDYLPGDIALYDRMTGRELLKFLANLRGGVDWNYVEQLAERFQSDLNPRIRTLSRGNKQKIGLIQAFMKRPELIIMDEPTAGLDPLMQQEFYALVEEVKAEGRTIFISSHIVPEVERICDRVGIIREGELATVEDVHVLKDRALHQLEFRFAQSVPPEVFANLPGVRDVVVEGTTLNGTVVGSPDAMVKAAANYEVVGLTSRETSLEDVFLAFYDGDSPNAA
ncbi:MAG: ABC transporter ATP-binding protein [Dehalococcoidia bacterium]|nr:ABC transporter ATP-binding protein [Dehalococcoidia bacterium]